MPERTYTFCDRCSPEDTVSDKLRRQEGRGWADGPAEYCIAELGWERRPEGVVCPECLEEEEASK